MKLDAEFYSVRSRLTGQHIATSGGYTQDIDMMATPYAMSGAQTLLDSLPNKNDHYIVRWTMVEI